MIEKNIAKFNHQFGLSYSIHSHLLHHLPSVITKLFMDTQKLGEENY
jgi:hypothetical protein